MDNGTDEKTNTPSTAPVSLTDSSNNRHASASAGGPPPPPLTDPQMMAILAAQEQIKRQLYGQNGMRWQQQQTTSIPTTVPVPPPSSVEQAGPQIGPHLQNNLTAQQFYQLQQQKQQILVNGTYPPPEQSRLNEAYEQPLTLAILQQQQQQQLQMRMNMPRPPQSASGGGGGNSLQMIQMQMLQAAFGRLGEALRKVPPYQEAVGGGGGMDEPAFFNSLSAFLACIGLPLRKVPSILGKPVPIHRLYQVVTGMGGFQRVSESQRWMAVAVSLGYPTTSLELLASIHSLYYTLLYAYEQYMFGKIAPEKIECKMMIGG